MLTDQAAAVVSTLRRVLALRSELGDAVADATHELSEDPVLTSYQAAALSPFGPADQQLLLEAPTAEARLAQLASLLADEEVVLQQRLRLDWSLDDDPGDANDDGGRDRGDDRD
jgi:Lon protease-like protein